ncbi:histidine kinase [[Limnothrix rosea] IAM M-220]|uniref:histidine kinase n=1 Tax=[Limnothrix rosea] IAM M-220 TaxID=454133 RepID=UPI0009644D0B|nr:histidine kinase [[Limnothrix rosea] IAM M-220]OKH13149.1 histidine kinase [[Limnothrix rosea] IAM M-220]
MSSEKHFEVNESQAASVVPQLQLLLFTDDRISHRADIKQVQDYLATLGNDYDFSLEIVDIKEQPQLVELYRLVATPSLVKVFPKPMQVFAGSSILPDLQRWWGQWQDTLEGLKQHYGEFGSLNDQAARKELDAERRSHSADVMRLSDEIFQLQREKEELAKQIEFKDQILAMLAHDLRSPLTGTSIALETLEIIAQRPETDKTSDLKQQLYQQAKNQLQIMNRMITELLDESRQLSTKLDIKPRRMDLNDLCQDVLLQMNSRFQRRSIKLTVDMPSDLPEVYGDAELLRQVLVNLLDNAIKYSSVNGEVRLVGLHRTLQKVQMSIVDHGHGIPEDEQEKIFEGHFRLKRDSMKEGYGLGLAVCRRIIQAHHGRIWVDSTLGQGSEFHFTLPVCVDRPGK